MTEVVKNNNEKWYALVTRPKAEKKVCARFLAEGHHAYLPLLVTVKQWSDRKKKVEVPMIPSYVFVKTEEKYLNDLLSDFGVVRVFKYLRKPAIIQDSEIEVLKTLTKDADSISVLATAAIFKGEQVKIVKGPFEGLQAECVQFQGKHRIVIKTAALGVVIEVNIPISFVEKIV